MLLIPDLQNDELVLKSRRTWGLLCSFMGVSLSEAVSSADLGGSSKYSNENFEG